MPQVSADTLAARIRDASSNAQAVVDASRQAAAEAKQPTPPPPPAQPPTPPEESKP